MKKILLTLITVYCLLLTAKAQPTTEIQKILQSDSLVNGDRFGNSVSISGDYAIIGAIHDYGDFPNGQGAGAAFIFYNNNGIWEQQAKLTSSDIAQGDRFGNAVSIFGDYAIVGAYLEGINGSAYIFKNNNGVWEEQAKLIAPEAGGGGEFGNSVAITDNYAVVGSWQKTGAVSNNIVEGAVYIFYNNNGTWEFQTKFMPPDGVDYQRFGTSVAILNDYLMVGTYDGQDLNGSVYVFFNNAGTWEQVDKLMPADNAGIDYFGYSVSMSGDYTVFGALGDTNENGTHSGSAYVYKNNNGVWEEYAKLLASDGYGYQRFGHSVSIEGDYIIVGARDDNDNGTESGAAYIFYNNAGTWEEVAKIKASDGEPEDWFGCSVAMSGKNVIIGAMESGDTGAAYIFAPPPPEITANPQNQEFCATGNSVFVTAASGNGTLLYQWQEDAGAGFTDITEGGIYTGTTADSLKIMPVDVSMSTYRYRCVINDDNGTVVSDTAILYVYDNPTTANAGEDKEICEITTTLEANTPTVGTGIWTTNGNAVINNQNNPNSNVSNLDFGDNEFVWEITNGICEASKDTVIITRIENTVTAEAGTDQQICETETGLSADQATSGTGLWTTSGNAVINNPSQYNTDVTNLDAGQNVFIWTITDGLCSASDDVAVLRETAVSIITQPTAYNATTGEDVSFMLEAEGSVTAWQWYKDQSILNNDNHVSGATTSILTIYNVTADYSGNYFCNVEGFCNEVSSDTVALDVVSGIENVQAKGIEVVPNPSTGQFVIMNYELLIMNVVVRDVTGKVVWSCESRVASKELAVDLSDKANGVYYLSVISGGKLVKTEKVVLKR